MSEMKIGDAPIIQANLYFPRIGVWTARIVLDATEAPTGAVTIEIASGEETVTLAGFAYRSGVFGGIPTLTVVGGAGGLGKNLASRYYTDATVRTILDDIATDTGETISDEADSDTLDATLPKWVRRADRASIALAALFETLDVSWRILHDGTLWVGADEYATVTLEHDLISDQHALGVAEISTANFPVDLVPGTTFLERKVDAIGIEFSENDLRTFVYFADVEESSSEGSTNASVST